MTPRSILYEGTTAIQALDFFFRKIVRDHGKALQFVLAQVTHTVENIDPSLKPQAELLRTALDDITAMTGALTGYLMSAAQHSSDIYKVGLGSVRYLLAVGDLLIGWRLLVLAGVAHAALADGPSQNDEAFYRGKIAVAAFFAKNMLPKLTGCAVSSKTSTTTSCACPKTPSEAGFARTARRT